MKLNLLDLSLIVVYVVGVTAWGAWLGRRQKDSKDYFLADHAMPWWAVCFSIIATETSVLTFISVPATAYTSDLWMIQLVFGYLIGRIVVAWILLPGYFAGELTTAYALLERRFGVLARRFASSIFLVTRCIASSVRMFAIAIPLHLIAGVPQWQAIVITGLLTLVYTYYGGLKAVVYVDVLQMFIFLSGGIAALIMVLQLVGGWEGLTAAAHAATANKMQVLHFSGGFKDAKWILTGLIGGAFLSMASHGVDQLIVQRLLASPNLKQARRALVSSGIFIVCQFTLFLIVGLGIFAYFKGRAFATPDEIFPTFIVEGLPAGISGLVIAGIFSVAMSSEASAINSLASALTLDIYKPLSGRGDDAPHMLKMGRLFTLMFGIILIVGGVLFQFVQSGTPVVVVALQIASFTYGGLLGGFLLGLISNKADQTDAIVAMSVAIAVMTTVWALQQFGVMDKVVDGLWFSLLGSALTVIVGTLSAAVRGSQGNVLHRN
ncbi:MAG TPA: sodium:solute symporter [Longimicrobiales bacterium]|nr:sodium:solute symporter [Longimicrobiales bacterium]